MSISGWSLLPIYRRRNHRIFFYRRAARTEPWHRAQATAHDRTPRPNPRLQNRQNQTPRPPTEIFTSFTDPVKKRAPLKALPTPYMGRVKRSGAEISRAPAARTTFTILRELCGPHTFTILRHPVLGHLRGGPREPHFEQALRDPPPSPLQQRGGCKLGGFDSIHDCFLVT